MRGWLLAILLPALATPAAAKMVDPFEVAGWEGGAVLADLDNHLVMCNASHEEPGGIWLNLGVAPSFDDLYIGLQNKNWTLEKGTQYPVVVMVDKNYKWQGRARALATDYALIDIPGEGSGNLRVMDSMMKAAQLVIEADRTYDFPLGKPAAEALEQVGTCVADRSAPPQPQQQAAPQSSPPSSR